MKKFLSAMLCVSALFASETVIEKRPVTPMPLSPDFVEELRSTGELGKVVNAWKNFNEQNVLYSIPLPIPPVTSGTGIAILVDFVDNEADILNHPPAEYDTLLFSEGILPTGSMKDFYLENSYGQFSFSGQPAPKPESGRYWYRISGSYDYWSEYYGFAHSGELAEAAVKAADPDIDFSKFDNDGPDGIPNSGDDDGEIDAVYVVHAGPGYEEGGCGQIWSHMSGTYYETNDNSVNGGKIVLGRYSIQPEERCNGLLINMGVFAHEYGHILGIPDLYDYDYDSKGAGVWTIMASGSWNGGGASPAHFDAWSKSQLGWVQPILVTDYEVNAELPAIEFSPTVYRLWTDGDTVSRQYFLIENRQRKGLFDYKLPADGLLIYHVDDFKYGNDDEYVPGEDESYHHFLVAVEQADGLFNLEHNMNSGDAGDPFPGTWERREFYTLLPYPTSRDYYEEDTRVGVLDISDSDSLMYADLDVGKHLPYCRLISVRQFGQSGGRIGQGETGNLVFNLENVWGDADNIEGELTIIHDAVTVTKSQASFGSVNQGETFSNISDPFQVTLSESAPGYLKVDVELKLQETSTGMEQSFSLPLVFGWPGLLLVNDAADESLTDIYGDVFDSIGVPYESATSEDIVALEDLLLASGSHDSVLVWFTGQESSTLSDSEIDLLQDFLSSGGKLIISSQNLGEDIGASSFYSNTLDAQFKNSNQEDILINGIGDNPIISADEKIAVSASYGTSKDGIAALAGASAILGYEDGNVAALITENDTSQVVYLAFPFEGLTGNPNVVLTKEEFMRRCFKWFGYSLDVAEEPLKVSTPSFQMLTSVVHSGDAAVLRIFLSESRAVELSIYDALGRVVASQSLGFLEQGNHAVEIPTDGLASGVYFAGVKTKDVGDVIRFVVLN